MYQPTEPCGGGTTRKAMEELSLRSLRKMGKQPLTISGIDDLGDDLLQNILARLPAISFASAVCVSRSWNSVCNRILSSPKLSSAISFNPSLENAVSEVIDKVLSEPIRPHFALASIGPSSSLQATLQLINGKLGSKIPIIVNVSEGIIGRDVRTNQFVEVQWELTEEEEEEEEYGDLPPEDNVNQGIILTVGYLPGLKAYIIPFLYHQEVGPQSFLVDEFVMDIKKYTSSVSDTESPTGIILFSERESEIKPVLQKFEFAFAKETIIVGDGGSHFLYRNDIKSKIKRSQDSTCAAVALLFARDPKRPPGIGETQFHVFVSTGISPVGQTFKAVAVKSNESSTWLTASTETDHMQMDGQAILDHIYEELGDRIQYPTFYIGVTKRRRCSVGVERLRRMQFHELHDVLGGDEEYLYVNSVGIKTGDPFRFYISDSKAALASCNRVSDDLRQLKDHDCHNGHASDGVCPCGKVQVFGGIIFSCCGRGNSFFTHASTDSAPFLNNFPEVPFGGTYCAGEIARNYLTSYDQENGDSRFVHCNQHVYSAVYLVMSYCRPATKP